MQEIASGAESIIYLDTDNFGNKKIVKKRIKKSYRISEIDSSLRTFRTKRESKVLERLQKINFNSPKLLNITTDTIEMEYIQGDQIKKLLNNNPHLSKIIGIQLTKMHNLDIIHGDLTTSNMILNDKELFFIDFGLSFFSKRIEDKAVDIHLFKQSLESKHHKVFDTAYTQFLEGYNPVNKQDILKRLSLVEQRGRYKEKC